MTTPIGINDRLSYLKMASSIELSNNQKDFDDGITDYLTTGVLNSGVSAFVGIYNTFHALGQMIGMADPEGRLDTASTIDSLFGADAAEFYTRHSTGIDATGLILGSIVPGGGAIRGLRALQMAGRVPGPARAATGLANADIVLGSSAIEAAKQSVLRAGASNLRDPAMYRAYATGLKQNVMEAAVFEAAMLATMNQHSSLNPDELGYLESFGTNAVTGLPFLFAGAGLGAGIDALRIRGAVKSFVGDEYKRTGQYIIPKFGDLNGLHGGSALHQIANAAAEHHKLFSTVQEGDWFAKRRYDDGRKMIRNVFMEVTKDLNDAGPAGREYLEKLVLNATPESLPRIAEELAGATKIRLGTMKEFQDSRIFYDRTVAPVRIEGQTSTELRRNLVDTIESVIGQLKDMGVKVSSLHEVGYHTREEIGRFASTIVEPNFVRQMANGMAYVSSTGNYTNLGYRRLALTPQDGAIPHGSMYFLHKGNIEKAHEAVVEGIETLRRLGADIKIPTLEEYTRRVALHEVSHLKNNHGKFFTEFVRAASDLASVDTPLGTKAILAEKVDMMGELLSLTMDSRSINMASHYNTIFGTPFTRNIFKLPPELRGKVLMEIVTSTEDTLSAQAESLLKSSGRTRNEITKSFNSKMLNSAYTTKQAELFAEAGYQLTDATTRQRAARIAPKLAAEFDSNPAVVKSWSSTKSYLNTRTGISSTGEALGLADLQQNTLKVVRTKAKADGASRLKVYSDALKQMFKSKYQDLFDPAIARDKLITDYLDYDAEWLMWSNVRDLPKFLADKEGNIAINSSNLPAMENLILRFPSAFEDGKVLVKFPDTNPLSIDIDFARQHLIESKQNLWMKMASTGEINEHYLAKMLNVDIDAAMGKLEPDNWIVSGKRFDRPETLVVDHADMSISSVDFDVRSQTAIAVQRELLDHQAKLAASEVLGTMYNNLPDLPMELIAQMSPLETRATLLTNARTIFGSAREQMQYIGKQVADFKERGTKEVHESFSRFNGVFNRQGNAGIRMELAMSENYARQDWYYLVNVNQGDNVVPVMVRKTELQKLADELADASEGEFDLLAEIAAAGKGDYVIEDAGTAEAILGLIGRDATNAGAPAAAQLSEHVSGLWKQHLKSNASRIDKKRKLAAAEGREFAVNPDLLYPPPKDLTKEKYFGFVTPKAFTEGSDPRKYMVYGRNEAELKAKIAQIESKYGNQYEVHSNKETKLFREYVKEYTRGEIFDDLFFDSGLKRTGSAAELIPNLDVNVSGTLDRMVSWHVNQEHAMIRKAVEVHYGEQVQALRNYDNVLSTFTESRATKRDAELSSIAKDAENLMLDKRSGAGRLEDLWVRVNDYIGEKGSNSLDSAFSAFRRGKVDINQASLNRFNAELESQGFQAPFENVFEAIAASPDPGVSRTLNNSVRTLNNLAGALMLRLDWAHSYIQLASTPILMMPVLLEAKAALKGTQAGAALENLTTVVNPANGLKEPSIVKMAFNAIKNYTTPEGKAFMQQLREANIVNDYLRQYSEIHDYSQLTGRHTMKAINDKIDQLAAFGSKVSMFTVSEEFTRFLVADSVRQIAQLRGITGNEMMAVVSSAVDKVHGIYLSNQRPQLFKGALGQAIGLYQTYFFNFVQNATKWIGDANTREALALGALQSSIFGLQSWPGFTSLNRWIGEANRNNTDIYEITNANDPKSMGAYAMFGLGSHAFGFPIDFYTRGDLAVRNATIVANPMKPMEIPAVDLMAKIVSNAVGIVSDLGARAANAGGAETLQAQPPIAEAFLHGLAHNGMNRPLQGLATILRNRVTSNYGQVYFQNANYVDHDSAQEIDWGRMFARLIGSRPLDESIVMNNYFRQKGYQANVRKEIGELGRGMQLAFASGEFDREQVGTFLREYESRGGDIQNFNAYFGRQFQQSKDGVMQKFQREMQLDSELKRTRDRLLLKQSLKPAWEYDSGSD